MERLPKSYNLYPHQFILLTPEAKENAKCSFIRTTVGGIEITSRYVIVVDIVLCCENLVEIMASLSMLIELTHKSKDSDSCCASLQFINNLTPWQVYYNQQHGTWGNNVI